ncbi:MAG: PhnA protein [Epsilonproteobacteria bacterium]|nr:PhnA protein [Campylobacterota bacterium]
MSCQLCGSDENVTSFEFAPEHTVELCATCKSQIESGELDEGHFNCLNDTMWSEESDVKVLTFILWNKLGRADMSDMMYLEEEEQKLADAVLSAEANKVVVKDANGVELKAGDSVVILKDLDVKGAGFTAKRGTTVRNISIPQDVEGHVEGRVNGTKIYLKTEFLKKA